MDNFLRHGNCPKCGSADNVAIYESGFEICYTPGCDYLKKGDGSMKSTSNTTQRNVTFFPLLEGDIPTFLTSERGITRESLIDYGVKKCKVDNAQSVQFPYYLNGVSVAAKYRACTDFSGKGTWGNKNYWSKGELSQCKLFGMQVASSKRKSVIITEGELDALAAHSMYGLAHNVVSIANGAAGASKAITQHMDWLIQFDTVYINFDMDDAGQSAANECMQIFPPGKARNVILPDGFKDACDMAAKDAGVEYRNAVNKAQGIVPQGVLDTDDVINSTLEYIMDVDQRKGVTTGYRQLDAVMGGFRPGELITLVAGTGVGKTTMTLNMTYNAAMMSNLKTLFIPLEMSYKQVLVRLMEIDIKAPIMTTNDNPTPVAQDEKQLRETLTKITNNVSIYNHIGALNLAKLLGVIEYYAISQKTKLIVLDHKDAAVNSLTDEGGGVKLIDNLMAELKRIAIQYNLTVLVVSHLSRSKDDKEDNKASLNRVRGSAGVAQNSDMVLGIERDRAENQLKMITLKAHRIFGIYDQFTLFYNKDTLRIEEAEVTDINEVTTNDYEDEKRVREADIQEPSRPTVRADKASVREELHSRLPDDNSEREGNINRSQGTVHAQRPNQTTSSQEGTPALRLKNLIHASQQPNKSKVETFLHLRRLGD